MAPYRIEVQESNGHWSADLGTAENAFDSPDDAETMIRTIQRLDDWGTAPYRIINEGDDGVIPATNPITQHSVACVCAKCQAPSRASSSRGTPAT
jgi:hypothetical protein